MGCAIHRTARKPERCGRFSSPLRKLRDGDIVPFTEVHSLSLAFARQLPQRGSREWAVPFIVPPGSRNVAGDFHRPYETQRWGHCTIHRSTLPQSRFARQLPQRGSRETFPFIVSPGSRNVAGDFHRPYERAGAIHRPETKEMGGGDGRRPLGGYCSTSNLYPTPQTVFRFHLGLTPSSFSRRRFTWTSTVRESPK